MEEKKIEVPSAVEVKANDTRRVKTVVEEIFPQQVGQPPTIGVKETNNIIPPHEIKEAKGAFVKYFLITFLVTILLLALAGGIWVYIRGIREQNLGVSETPTPQATLTTFSPAPSASPSTIPVPLSGYKISVLNGSGKIGAATTAKNLLTKAGFKVASTGNAENFNFDKTLIQVKSSVSSDVLDKLKTSLAPSFSPQVGNTLDSADQFDVIITVGLQ